VLVFFGVRLVHTAHLALGARDTERLGEGEKRTHRKREREGEREGERARACVHALREGEKESREVKERRKTP
jgi:hypothetical protein